MQDPPRASPADSRRRPLATGGSTGPETELSAGPKGSALSRLLLVDHYRRPRNRAPLAHADVSVTLVNPLCGDRVEVELRSAEGSSLEIAARGRGCSILVAAASVMTELVAGREPAEARQLHAWLRRLLADEEPDAEVDERLAAFRGIGRLPFRERCAELPWEALEEALGRLP